MARSNQTFDAAAAADLSARPGAQHPVALIGLARALAGRVLRSIVRQDAGLNASEAILSVCQLIDAACAADKDAAIATILLPSDVPYSVKHPVDAAIIVRVMLPAFPGIETQLRSVMAAALTMNIGMLEFQDDIHNRLGSLTAEQRLQIRTHPEKSHALLQAAGVTDEIWLDTVLHHHETLDGSGYPHALRNGAIQPGCRALTLADIFCAWVCPRGDRLSMLPNAALREIFLLRGERFDTTLSALMIKHVGIHPAGTAMELKDGRIAVVTRQSANASRPIAAIVADHNGARQAPYLECDIDLDQASSFPPARLAGLAIDPQHLWAAQRAANGDS